jgi:hypothetical protein
MSDAPDADRRLATLVAKLGDLAHRTDDKARVDRIRLLEQLKAVAGAAQAREAAAFAVSQREKQRAEKTPEKRVGRGIASQVGLARRISPNLAARYLGWATILVTELPETYLQLMRGEVSEWRAVIVARETIWLSREQRAQVDAELAPRLPKLSDRAVEAEARRIAYRLDPRGFVDRRAAAENERRVWLRPAPDTMVRLTALLPVAQGVAAYAALTRAADTSTGVGDERGRGQIMADTLVERVTGQAAAADVPVTVNVIVTDQALLNPATAGGAEPAIVDGYGPIPADLARELVTKPSDSTPSWLRRLFSSPTSGQLVAMESKQRCFPAGLANFIRFRDQYCRTPWCGAPIRHPDHIRPAGRDGPTSEANGEGYCEACNYAKQAMGWITRRVDNDDGVHEVETITPTGHRYRSRPPDAPTAA